MGWRDFEMQCTNYLNRKFSNIATFTLEGGADSTKSDILMTINNGNTFYIEAKCSPAQCGQFVLLPNISTRQFDYSEKNMSKLNQYSKIIIEYMNSNFDEYRNAGTSGKDILFNNCEDIFSKWIICYYKEKNTAFFITNNFIICPIDDFSKYFSIKATYRIKRSGSSSVGKSNISRVLKYISENYKINTSTTSDDKLYIMGKRDLNNQRFILDNFEYMFSLRDDRYEIRKLSNTYNANVIFSITVKENIQGLCDNDFIALLF